MINIIMYVTWFMFNCTIYSQNLSNTRIPSKTINNLGKKTIQQRADDFIGRRLQWIL